MRRVPLLQLLSRIFCRECPLQFYGAEFFTLAMVQTVGIGTLENGLELFLARLQLILRFVESSSGDQQTPIHANATEIELRLRVVRVGRDSISLRPLLSERIHRRGVVTCERGPDGERVQIHCLGAPVHQLARVRAEAPLIERQVFRAILQLRSSSSELGGVRGKTCSLPCRH